MPKKRNTKLPAIKQLPSGAWRAQVTVEDPATGKSRRVSLTNPDYHALVLEITQMQMDKLIARRDPNYGKLRLKDALDLYIQDREPASSPKTVREYLNIARNHLNTLKPLYIQDITSEDVQREIAVLSSTLAPKTVRNVYGLLTATLKYFCVPTDFRVKLPQRVKPDTRIPTETEVKLMLDTAKERYTYLYIPLLLASCCGLRRSEICGLTWDDVNLKDGTAHIRQAKVMDKTNRYVEKTTKTVSGDRVIRLPPPVLIALKAAYDESPRPAAPVTALPQTITVGFTQRLQPLLGITPHYTLHELRHYTVSVMVALNIPKYYIVNYVGHQDESMVNRVYTHIMESKKTEIDDQMAAYFAKNL